MKNDFDIPHKELIVENSEIHIPSIFMFDEGIDKLYAFLYACEKANCTVIFDNESVVIDENSPYNFNDLRLVIYASIAQSHKFGDDYIKYRENTDKMIWRNATVLEV